MSGISFISLVYILLVHLVEVVTLRSCVSCARLFRTIPVQRLEHLICRFLSKSCSKAELAVDIVALNATLAVKKM